MAVLELSNLPYDVTAGQAYNLLWLFPFLKSYRLDTREDGEIYLTVTLSDDDIARHFYTVMHGRRFDIFNPTSRRMVVTGLGSPPEAVTLWGSGFTRDEDSKNVESGLEALNLEGIKDIRCVMRTKPMVFVDFDTLANAWQALELLASGLCLRTGRCHFEMSRGR